MNTRCLHITGNQAICLLRAARAGEVVTATACCNTHVTSWGSELESLDGLGLDGLLSWLGVCAGRPLEALVPDASSRSWASGVSTKVLSQEMPCNAFLELQDGTNKEKALHFPSDVRVFIDAPPLALIGAAHGIETRVRKGSMAKLEGLLRLVALASEFCGHYARDPFSPLTKRGHYDKPDESTRFTNADDLRRFMTEAPTMRGLAFARKVSEHAIDGSGSPMETYLNLAWTLPTRMGGLSLPKPLANKQLVPKEGHAARLKHKSIRPDFQWPDLGAVGEYLGDEDHSSHDARVEDKNRLQDYIVSGYKAFVFMYDDVRNAAALNHTAIMLASEFAKSGRQKETYRLNRLLKDESFLSRQARLIATLLPPITRFGE